MSKGIKVNIKGLIEARDEKSRELDRLDRAIGSLREICAHEFVADGSDGHYRYERCRLCLLRVKSYKL